eukprot:SAG31_NODE_25298_length_464_cov_0.846575_1_plen_50_part_10
MSQYGACAPRVDRDRKPALTMAAACIARRRGGAVQGCAYAVVVLLLVPML